REGVRVSLAESVHIAFLIGLSLAIVAAVISLFIREIPLKRMTAAQERAMEARGETPAAPAAV
ncbi:MAG: MFS transporter, partial [Candidatus Dormibacteraeota bacterium]|nr:MFS transporter [Candidatus Dormibacteraeota bacterium]